MGILPLFAFIFYHIDNPPQNQYSNRSVDPESQGFKIHTSIWQRFADQHIDKKIKSCRDAIFLLPESLFQGNLHGKTQT
jgi:hypothetical protein